MTTISPVTHPSLTPSSPLTLTFPYRLKGEAFEGAERVVVRSGEMGEWERVICEWEVSEG